MALEKEAADHKKKNDLIMHRQMLVEAEKMNKGSRSPEAKNNLLVIQTKLTAIDKALADLEAGITPEASTNKPSIARGLSKLSSIFKEIKETHQELHPKSENTPSFKK